MTASIIEWINISYPQHIIENVIEDGYYAIVYVLVDKKTGFKQALKVMRKEYVLLGFSILQEFNLLHTLSQMIDFVPKAYTYYPEIEAFSMEFIDSPSLSITDSPTILAMALHSLHSINADVFDLVEHISANYYFDRLNKIKTLSDYHTPRLNELKTRIQDNRAIIAADVQALDSINIPPFSILHLDVNEDNVLLSKGKVVLLDFGQALIGNPVFELGFISVLSGWNPSFSSQIIKSYSAISKRDFPKSSIQLASRIATWRLAISTLLDCAHLSENWVDDFGIDLILSCVKKLCP